MLSSLIVMVCSLDEALLSVSLISTDSPSSNLRISDSKPTEGASKKINSPCMICTYLKKHIKQQSFNVTIAVNYILFIDLGTKQILP